jgi:hypothetical protein
MMLIEPDRERRIKTSVAGSFSKPRRDSLFDPHIDATTCAPSHPTHWHFQGCSVQAGAGQPSAIKEQVAFSTQHSAESKLPFDLQLVRSASTGLANRRRLSADCFIK